MNLKIKSTLIFFLCFFYFVLRGKANGKVKSFKKILIIQTAKLGDMVCTTPMFRAVKEKYPKMKVFVVGNRINKELLAGNSDVDNYFVWEKNFWSLIKSLRKEKIDFACDTNPSFFGLALLYLSGIRTIAVPCIENGYSPVETRLYKILRKLVLTVPHRMGNYAPGEYLRLLEPAGIFSSDTKKYLYFSKEAEKKIDEFFTASNLDMEKDFLVGIAPSVGNKIKEWDIEKFAQLANYISSHYHVKIIIIGGKNDIGRAKDMVDKLSSISQFINTAGLLSIDELKAMISKLSLFISVDTGSIYIAEAYNVPTIDIIGPMDEREQPPVRERNKVVYLKDRKEPAIHIMNSSEYDYKEARRQIDDITTDMVINKLKDLDHFIGLKPKEI